MEFVSSLGGPRVLLPSRDVTRWIDALGATPSPNEGLYGLACSIDTYCGIIRPWGTPILIFGDDPSDIYWLPNKEGGLFVRWVAANSLPQLVAFAETVGNSMQGTEKVEWEALSGDYTLMDCCASADDDLPRINMSLPQGDYIVESQYAEMQSVMTIVHRLRIIGRLDRNPTKEDRTRQVKTS